MSCVCDFPRTCKGTGRLDCLGRVWGGCFCSCGCTEECAGCDACLDQEEPDDDEDNECWACGGEGFVLGDCGEDTCCCADPETQHPMVRCETCGGKG